MKRISTLFILTFLLLFSLVGCTSQAQVTMTPTSEKLKVATTIFPQYDFRSEEHMSESQ